MLLATVPAAPPTRKNQRTTSCPAPISAKVPYQRGSRLILSALEWVSIVSSFTSQQSYSELQLVHQSPQGKAERSEDSRRGCHLWPRTGGTPVFRQLWPWTGGTPVFRQSCRLGPERGNLFRKADGVAAGDALGKQNARSATAATASAAWQCA